VSHSISTKFASKSHSAQRCDCNFGFEEELAINVRAFCYSLKRGGAGKALVAIKKVPLNKGIKVLLFSDPISTDSREGKAVCNKPVHNSFTLRLSGFAFEQGVLTLPLQQVYSGTAAHDFLSCRTHIVEFKFEQEFDFDFDFTPDKP
jgi:hypothetical protein